MNVEVTRYRKPGGYLTRYWSVLVNGELLAVILYRKGAEAVARAITHAASGPLTVQDAQGDHAVDTMRTSDEGRSPQGQNPRQWH